MTNYALVKLVFYLFIVSLVPNTNNNNKHFIYVSSVFSRVEAPLLGETGNQINTSQMLVFGERGKPEYPGKNLL